MDELAVLFLKTYQVWHHRRLLVALTRKPKRELDFIRKGLEADAKNYHTWSYRQWLLGTFGGRGANVTDAEGGVEDVDEDLWIGELDFVDTMLAQDVRNNSAWHHRFFVVWGCGVREGDEDRERVLKRELTYVFSINHARSFLTRHRYVKQNISLAPSNPSAWNYLRGVLTHTRTPFSAVADFALPYAYPRGAYHVKDVVDLENPSPSDTAQLPCVQAMEFMADVWEREGGEEKTEQAVKMWTLLANEHDTIRKK